jgi:hypothetical protein
VANRLQGNAAGRAAWLLPGRPSSNSSGPRGPGSLWRFLSRWLAVARHRCWLIQRHCGRAVCCKPLSCLKNGLRPVRAVESFLEKRPWISSIINRIIFLEFRFTGIASSTTHRMAAAFGACRTMPAPTSGTRSTIASALAEAAGAGCQGPAAGCGNGSPALVGVAFLRSCSRRLTSWMWLRNAYNSSA